MKILFWAFSAMYFSVLSFSAWGACTEFGAHSDTVAIGITDNGCSTDVVITFQNLRKANSSSTQTVQSFPFKDECKWAEPGLTCHASGHAPLSGTTWKWKSVVPNNKKPKCHPVSFECIEGCRKGGMPTEMYDFEEPEGECEN